jgi:hypothetical protein
MFALTIAFALPITVALPITLALPITVASREWRAVAVTRWTKVARPLGAIAALVWVAAVSSLLVIAALLALAGRARITWAAAPASPRRRSATLEIALATAVRRRSRRAEGRPLKAQGTQLREHFVHFSFQPIQTFIQGIAAAHVAGRTHHRSARRSKAAASRAAEAAANPSAKLAVARTAIFGAPAFWTAFAIAGPPVFVTRRWAPIVITRRPATIGGRRRTIVARLPGGHEIAFVRAACGRQRRRRLVTVRRGGRAADCQRQSRRQRAAFPVAIER